MRRVEIGEQLRLPMPYSEVCMHLRVAGLVRTVWVLAEGAQLLDEDGALFSFPITHGEAGIYRDAEGLYIETRREVCPAPSPAISVPPT